jgi:hypothetical protein
MTDDGGTATMLRSLRSRGNLSLMKKLLPSGPEGIISVSEL